MPLPHLTDETTTVSSPQSSTELDAGADAKSPRDTSSSIVSDLNIRAGQEVINDDLLPVTLSSLSGSTQEQQQQHSPLREKTSQFDLMRKKKRERLDQFELEMSVRKEKAREEFKQERLEGKQKLLEEYDCETTLLEEKMLGKLHDDFELEYANLDTLYALQVPTSSAGASSDNNWSRNMMFPSPLHRATLLSATAAAANLAAPLLDRVRMLDRDRLFKNTSPPGTEHPSDVKKVTRRRVPRVGDYVLFKLRGTGTSARVYECLNCLDHKHYAVRVIAIQGKENLTEVALMKKLSHPNIIQLHEVLYTQTNYYMVLELCKGELLKNEHADEPRKSFDEDECRDIFQQLILGMEYLHKHKVAHLDIKPGNLLISYEGKLKIADFGISQMFATGQTMTTNNRKGTVAFMAPEIFQSNGSDFTYSGRRADIWSMGVTLFRMWNGEMPFVVPQGTRKPIFNTRSEFKDGTPDHLKALLDKMLESDPAKRITMDQLRDDPWVIDSGRKPLAKSKQDNVGVQIEVTEEDKKMAVKVTSHHQQTVSSEEGDEAKLGTSQSWHHWDEDDEEYESEEGGVDEDEEGGMGESEEFDIV